jgi:hypothetical protein
MARFQDIPQFTRSAGYMVNVGLDYLARHYARYVVEYGLDVCPDFQRGYVWRPEQKVRFMEYMLRGGLSGLDIYINGPTWAHGRLGPEHPESWLVLVDGKQRLDAALGFLNNEFPIFDGVYHRDFTDHPRITCCNFRWHVNDLATREECLQWYLDLNTGGTVHTEEELGRVRDLITKGEAYVRPPHEVVKEQARIDRPIFAEVFKEIAEETARRDAATLIREAEAANLKPKRKGVKRGSKMAPR